MRYDKPHLSLEEQVALLRARGMLGDPARMRAKLRFSNYHRLAAYWHTFREFDDTFRPSTTFDDIWRVYVFDRRLRLVVLDAIERLEVALRTQIALHHSREFGPFGYAEQPESLPGMSESARAQLHSKVRDAFQRACDHGDPYFRHFSTKYGDLHEHPPIWAAVELLEFGPLIGLYKSLPVALRREVSGSMGLPRAILASWLESLRATRNICAHHGRLWNRVLGLRPKEPPADRFAEWHLPEMVDMSRVYGTLRICDHIIRHAAQGSSWRRRLDDLLAEFPEVDRRAMGFPAGYNRLP